MRQIQPVATVQKPRNRVQQVFGAIIIGVFRKPLHIGRKDIAHEIRKRMARFANRHIDHICRLRWHV